MTETLLRVYLDVDGVFNAVTRDDPDSGWSEYKREKVIGWPITYAPEFVSIINNLAKTPGVEMYWLTTWCDNAPAHLAPALGIDGVDWPVVGFDHMRRATHRSFGPWWKYLAIADHIDGYDGPVLWIDDDHGFDPACSTWLEIQPQIRTIAPLTHLGVTRAEADLIEQFVEQVRG